MWNRKDLKNRTKGVMKHSYWTMFGVSLVVIILSGDFFRVTRNFSSTRDSITRGSISTNGFEEYAGILMPILVVFSALAVVGLFLGIFYTFFIANSIEVGKCRYFLKNTEEKAEFSLLFSVFGSNYLNVIKIMFVRNIKLVLWTLLFIIPGIIKMYEYRMIPYILAEDPGMDMSEAFYKSRQMTSNQKFDMFFLDLSFIGWNIVGVLLFGIGTLFVQPYKNGVDAQLYVELKHLS